MREGIPVTSQRGRWRYLGGEDLCSSVDHDDVDIKVSYINYGNVVARLGTGVIVWSMPMADATGTVLVALARFRYMVSGFPGISTPSPVTEVGEGGRGAPSSS